MSSPRPGLQTGYHTTVVRSRVVLCLQFAIEVCCTDVFISFVLTVFDLTTFGLPTPLQFTRT